MIIAIDGPAGSGKSTVSKIVAQRLGFKYISTGAIYRAVTLKTLQNGLDLTDSKTICKLIDKTKIEFKDISGEQRLFLDGKDVTNEIRDATIDSNINYIADSPSIREKLILVQRKCISHEDAVIEGRDIGTVIFPDAEKKFFLDADIKERAKRRYSETKLQGKTINFNAVLEDIKRRDYKDSTRNAAPLKRIKESVYIDSTNMSIDEVVGYILKSIPKISTKSIEK